MLTLGQLIDLGNNINIDIFEGLTLPEESPLDRETLINAIIMRCGLNIPMYSDPYVYRSAINVWSAKNQYTFKHVGKIFIAEYSPIENKDYYTDHSTSRSRDMTDNTTGSNSKAENTSSNNNSTVTEQKISTHSGTDTTTDTAETSAYNETTYQDKDKDVTTLQHGEQIADSGNGSTNASQQIAKSITGSLTNDKTIDEDETITETAHEHGNIGVSTFFDLETGEYNLLKDFRPYDFLAEIFENEMTLAIY